MFDDIDQLKDAVHGILRDAPDVSTAKRWIRALPGPSTVRGGVGGVVTDDFPIDSRGIHFDIPGDIIVRFNDDGTREAMFTIATQHDDPDPQLISVHWAPGFLTREESRVAREVLFG